MNLQPKHIPYGIILILVAWILIADRVHENRIADMQLHSDSLEARLRRIDIIAKSWELSATVAASRYEAIVADRYRADAEVDSLLNIINSTPHAPRPRRPRTAPELRGSILRAARTK